MPLFLTLIGVCIVLAPAIYIVHRVTLYKFPEHIRYEPTNLIDCCVYAALLVLALLLWYLKDWGTALAAFIVPACVYTLYTVFPAVWAKPALAPAAPIAPEQPDIVRDILSKHKK